MREILKEHFGFNDFKPIQEKAIKEILAKKDILVVLPTGSGKSLIYQLPSLMMDGITVVISPLIALMQDQIAALELNGIKAKMISSNNTAQENAKTISKLQNKKLKFLYIAPERFADENFFQILQKCKINFFVIDEAHCVSEWGHEFRNDYRKLRYLKKWFQNIPVAAFTATATKYVQEDILKTLQINSKEVLRGKTIRNNLLIRCKKRVSSGKKEIMEFLKKYKDESGIVYCFTRKETEKLSIFLNQNGFISEPYHAKLPHEQKNKIFDRFKNDKTKIIVATIAFGMGIDKSNIRFVLHTSMPKTLESYFQEIGRAGRDGLLSETMLLYSKSDEVSKRVFIDELPPGQYRQNMYEKLSKMYLYCITSKCRHKYIAEYFGDRIKECGKLCDNCLEQDLPKKDITIEAQKLLSAVLRTKERFGQNHIINILRGSKEKKIIEFSHDKLSVYGIATDISKRTWIVICERLFDIDALKVGEHGSLKITQTGKKIVKNIEKVYIKEKDLQNCKEVDNNNKKYKNKAFDKLKELRSKLAKDEKVPAYIIFSDKTLLEISEKLPQTKEEFLNISGIGEHKLKKYSDIFITHCKELKSDTPKKLSQTYILTLKLIKDGKNIVEICKERELKTTTILNHIEKLVKENMIDKETKKLLIEPLKKQFPKEIKVWIDYSTAL